MTNKDRPCELTPSLNASFLRHKISSGKILFDWSESNNPNTYWTDYCFIKSPVTISDDDC